MSDDINDDLLTVYMVGLDAEADELPKGPFVILTGSVDAVRAAARLFGEEVRLTSVSEEGAA